MSEEKLVPKLRFNGFDDEWKSIKLNETGDIVTGATPPTKDKDNFTNSGYIWVTPGDIGSKKIVSKTERNLSQKGLKKGRKLESNSILVTCIGATIGKICMIKETGSCNQQLNAIIPNKNFFPDFIYYNIQKTAKNLLLIAGNTATPILNKKSFGNLSYNFPSYDEQKKIGLFIDKIDKKIDLLEKKYESYVDFKKYLMQQIFAQKLRFKDDNNEKFDDWKERKLFEFLTEHKLKSTGKEEVYSVSVHKGLVNQVEHLGRAFSAPDTSKYNLVKPGDIVYTKSPTGDFPLGIIKQSRVDKNVIVSPLYGVFTPETYELGYILNDYFESNINTHNYLHSIVQKGAKNTMNITNKTFLSKKLLVPTDKREQHKIAECLSNVNESIKIIEDQKNHVEDYKKGLLQQMFV